MTRREQDRLRDIRDAIGAIDAYVRRPPGLDDPLVCDAVLYQFVVIGEAVKNLAPDIQARAPEVPWRDVAGFAT